MRAQFVAGVTSAPFCLLTLLLIGRGIGELCPPLFGEFECPVRYNCVLGVCKNVNDQSPPQNCAEIECGQESRCVLGRCQPIEGTPCNRNVLVGDKTAHAIVSDCGRRGKCLSGKCAIDKCVDVLCEEGEYCRDGKCQKLLAAFCFSDYDCGPLIAPSASATLLQCRANKCELRQDGDEALLRTAIEHTGGGVLKCDPGQTLQDGKCISHDGCAQLVCSIGETCLNGFCISTTIECGGNVGEDVPATCPEQMICRERICVPDPCLNRCPPEHACINAGECRLLQGLACVDSCPPPFECMNGACIKDECRRRVCQIGERCEGGLCVRVEDRACRSKERDCGEAFECVEGRCKDKIILRTLENFVEFSTTKATLKRIRN